MNDKIRILGRNDILQTNDQEIELVAVPGWGGSVYVRSLTGTERDRLEASMVQHMVGKKQSRQVNLNNLRAKLCAMACCDEAGNPIFTEADVIALGKKNAANLQAVFEVAQKLSGLTDEAVDELTEDMQENPFEDSSSD